MELKFTSKSLQRQARKCEKEEKSEKLKVKKAIENNNMDGARIYAENAIRKRTEQMKYLQLASRQLSAKQTKRDELSVTPWSDPHLYLHLKGKSTA
ncbi:hypothetical protein K1719_042122 [Acacia pycnantha]|nr:hypothetical protein K1719_042122 [Acacia pycnantha]